MKSRKMTDIAKLADVSVSTVSRALAGSSLVAKAKRDHIVALAAEMGYVVDTAARNLRLKRSHAICLAIPLAHESSQRLTDPFFSEMICHLADAVTERGYGLYLQKVVPPMDNWLPKLLTQHKVDGLLVLGQSTEHAALQSMARQFHPMVVWGGHELGTDYCTVGSDNIRGGKLAVKHLIGLGRQRIAFLGDVNAPEFRLRQLGWREALKEARLPADADLLIPSSLSESGAYEAMSHYLQTGPKIDAVFAASDLLAVSALKALRDAKLSVPNDVAVIGFDDIQIAPLVHPALTTVRQDLVQGARIMVECLFKRMGGDPADSVTLAPELIVRESA